MICLLVIVSSSAFVAWSTLFCHATAIIISIVIIVHHPPSMDPSIHHIIIENSRHVVQFLSPFPVLRVPPVLSTIPAATLDTDAVHNTTATTVLARRIIYVLVVRADALLDLAYDLGCLLSALGFKVVPLSLASLVDDQLCRLVSTSVAS